MTFFIQSILTSMNLNPLSRLAKSGIVFIITILLLVSWQSGVQINRIDIPSRLRSEKSDHVGKGISSLASEISMIKLETTPKALIGKGCSMKPTNFGFIIWDYQSKKVFTFDKKGRFIAVIGNIGKGPQEYTRLVNFLADPFPDQVIIVDQGTRKILFFKYTGEFVSAINLKVDPSGGMLIHDRNIITILYQDWNTPIDKERIGIMQVNREGKFLAKKLLGTGLKRGDFNHHSLNKLIAVGDGFLYSVYPHTNVYKTDFNLRTEKEFLSFDLGDMQTSYKTILDKDHLTQTEDPAYVRNFRIFKNNVWIEVINQSYSQTYLYDLKNRKLEFISMMGEMKEDLTNSNPFEPEVFTDEYLYELTDPGSIQFNCERYGINLKTHYPDWSLDDNPIIRIARLK